MQIDPFLFLVLVELLLVTAGAAIAVVMVITSRKQKDKQAARTLVDRIKEDRSRRKEETRKVLVSRYGLDDAAAKELSTQIDRGERYFYQMMINAYLKRDYLVMENLNVEFESSVEPYRTLEVSGPVKVTEKEVAEAEEGLPADTVTPAAEEQPSVSAECERLKVENTRLSQELRITMETMGRMLNEYSNMFGGGADFDRDGQNKLVEMFEQMRAGLVDAGSISGEVSAPEPPQPVEPSSGTEPDEAQEESLETLVDTLPEEDIPSDSDDDVLASVVEDIALDGLDGEEPLEQGEDLELPGSEPESEPEPKPE